VDLKEWGYRAPSGSVVAVEYGDHVCQEIWVADAANVGNWYPANDDDQWLRLKDRYGQRFDIKLNHPTWDDVLARGRVTLLVAAQDEVYAAGWQAGRADLLHKIEELADEPAPDRTCAECGVREHAHGWLDHADEGHLFVSRQGS
jgi:hypothetical protein